MADQREEHGTDSDEGRSYASMYRSGQEIECWLTDMDGVLVHENQPIPGAAELIQRWVDDRARRSWC